MKFFNNKNKLDNTFSDILEHSEKPVLPYLEEKEAELLILSAKQKLQELATIIQEISNKLSTTQDKVKRDE
jgi:hypothetical protein